MIVWLDPLLNLVGNNNIFSSLTGIYDIANGTLRSAIERQKIRFLADGGWRGESNKICPNQSLPYNTKTQVDLVLVIILTDSSPSPSLPLKLCGREVKIYVWYLMRRTSM